MAKIDDDSILNFILGQLGKQLVVKRSKSGKRYVCAKAEYDPNDRSDKQKAHDKRFNNAIAYAKKLSKNPELKKLYLTKPRPGCSAFIIAWRDAFHPPEVKQIIHDGYHGRTGDVLSIHAEDDFMVVKTVVSIYDERNNLIESGEAVNNHVVWTYTTQTNVKGVRITATAYDLAENEGFLTVEI